MTIKLNPNSELELAINNAVLAGIVMARWSGNDPNSDGHLQAMLKHDENRAHLLAVIRQDLYKAYLAGWGKRRVTSNTQIDAYQAAYEIMGAINRD